MEAIYKPFFTLDVYGELALLTIVGLWDVEYTKKYEAAIDQQLKLLQNKKIFSITNLEKWSIPPFEILEKVNEINQKVSLSLDFKHASIICPPKNKTLFTEIITEFNHENTGVEVNAFLNYKEALNWGTSLGYDCSQMPKDYFLKLYKALSA